MISRSLTFVELVTIALNSSTRSAAVKLEIGSVFNENHVSTPCANTVNYPIQLKGPCRASAKGNPSAHAIISGRHVN